jgi:hypothetical protein
LRRWLTRPWLHLGLGVFILLLDLLTGPYLLFPILFVVPVSLSAWFYRARMAYFLAVSLPASRLLIAELVDRPHPLPYSLANALIRAAVLLFLAFLMARNARQTRQLQERVSGFVTMCAWSRTVEYEGQWITFEQYLKRRFNLDTSHGISPAEAEKVFGQLNDKAGDV